jgi:hypothetical protein
MSKTVVAAEAFPLYWPEGWKRASKVIASPFKTPAIKAHARLLREIKALGGSLLEREGSRVRIELNGEQWRCHRPHSGKEAKRYQVEEARELLERAGVQQ